MSVVESSPLVAPSAFVNAFYYLDNFHVFLETLERRDDDLLDTEERRFIHDFCNLPQPSRALLVRMVMRKGPVFRLSRLAYPEIADTAAAALPLIRACFVDERPRLSLEEVFRLFPKQEIANFLQLSPCRSRESKPALLDRLREAFPGARTIDAWGWSSAVVYRLEVADLCTRLRVMFFGNFRQDLTEFVLTDLGVFKYERVDWQALSRPFSTRRQVEDFHRLYRCREMLRAGVELSVIEQAMPASIGDCDWLEERRETLRFQIARAYERAGDRVKACELYRTCAHPEARTRQARLCAAANGFPKRRVRLTAPVPVFEVVIARSPGGRSVEHLVAEHVLATTADMSCVRYVENALISSLFGLLCWPAIFTPVPGAFFHAFHRGPADLSNVGFFERRRREFAACFAELDQGTYQETILQRFARAQGVASPFVAWGLLDEPLLRMALACFPAAHLKLWFEWMVRDISVRRAGFPDLVQFFPQAAHYRLIEVKAPGDRLQENQRQCLQFMLGHRMPVSVCRVRWAATTPAGQEQLR